MKKNYAITIRLLIIIIVPVLITFFIFYPFEKTMLISVVSKYENSEVNGHATYYNGSYIRVDKNSTFTISDADFVTESIPLTIIDSIFKIPTIGLYEICFHNNDSTFYYNGYKTNLKQVAVFVFNDKTIKVDDNVSQCQPIFHNVKFFVIVYTRYESPSLNDIHTFVNDDKKYQEYIKSKNINMTNHVDTLDPVTNAEVYVNHSWITEIIVGFTVFIIWTGIVLIINQTAKFVRGRID